MPGVYAYIQHKGEKICKKKIHKILDALEESIRKGWGVFEVKNRKFYVVTQSKMEDYLENENR